MASMDEFFRAEKTGETPVEKSKPEKAKPKGMVQLKVYENYYDNNSTITTAQASDPNDQDHPNYNRERVFQSLGRRAEMVWVANDAASGGPTLFVIASHIDVNQFSRERPIYPQQYKVYYNIFELRLRSSVASTPYRVTEYSLGLL